MVVAAVVGGGFFDRIFRVCLVKRAIVGAGDRVDQARARAYIISIRG